MNNVNLIGNLTFDPQLKVASNGNVYTFFVIAVNRNYRNKQNVYEADFIPVIAWEKRAQHIVKYFKKGNKIGVQGRIKTYSVLDDENEMWKNFYCVNVESSYFCEKAPNNAREKEKQENDETTNYAESDYVVPELYDTMNSNLKGK